MSESHVDTPESFEVVLTISRLGRDLRKLAGEEAEVRALYDQDRQALDSWRDDRLAGLDERREELERQLENACRAGLDLDGRKTWQTPNVRASLRQPSTSTEILDRGALERWLVKWAIANGREDLLHVTAVSTALEEAGVRPGPEQLGTSTRRSWQLLWEDEVIPGVAVDQPREPTFSYRLTSSAGS